VDVVAVALCRKLQTSCVLAALFPADARLPSAVQRMYAFARS
jgi:hypothetical protein